MSISKRVRDPEADAIRAAFQTLMYEVTSYRERLATELAQEQNNPGAYTHLVTALKRQIDQVSSLATILDEDVLDLVIGVANTSGYVAHARTRDFF